MTPAAATPPSGVARRRWRRPLLLVLAGYAALLLLTFRDYGVTWDESAHAEYGAEVVRWYASGFEDDAALHRPRYRNLGAFFDVTAHLLARVPGLGLFEARHLLGALFGLLGVAFTARLAGRLAGERAAVLAALALLLLPAYYGHAFNNPKDVPFAALSIVALYYVAVAVGEMPRLSAGLVTRLGLAIGLTLGVRIVGLALFVYLAAAFALWLAGELAVGALSARRPAALARAVTAFAGRLAAVGLLAAVVMLPWWPALQVDPARHLRETLHLVWNFPWNLPVLFEGRQVPATQLPWYYASKSIAITLPEFYLILLPAGAALATVSLVRAPRPWLRDQRWIVGVILGLSVGVPIASQALRGAVVYGGWRHFLFVAPMLAVAAGWVLARLVEPGAGRRWRIPVAAAAGLSMALTAVDMVRLHPYQTVYFNRALAGGLPGAAGDYETDYWGTSYKEGVAWLQANHRSDDPARRIKVTSCSHPVSTSYFLTDPRFEYVGHVDRLRDQPDVLLATTRWGCHRSLPGRVLHVVRRFGVPLLYVVEVAPRQPVSVERPTAHPPVAAVARRSASRISGATTSDAGRRRVR